MVCHIHSLDGWISYPFIPKKDLYVLSFYNLVEEYNFELATGCPVPDLTTFLALQKYFFFRFFIVRYQFPFMITC